MALFERRKHIVGSFNQLQSQGALAESGGRDGRHWACSHDMKILFAILKPKFHMLLKIHKVQDWIN